MMGTHGRAIRYDGRPPVPTAHMISSTWPYHINKPVKFCLTLNPSVSDLESSSLAGLFAFIRSNLCTRP